MVSVWLHQKTFLGLHFEDFENFFSEKSKLDSVSRFVCLFLNIFFLFIPFIPAFFSKLPETLERLHGNRVVQDKISSTTEELTVK